MAKKSLSSPSRGRTWLALILVCFVLVSAGVIHRRTTGMARALELKQLDQELQALESRKTKLQSEIESAKDLSRIGPIAEDKLGMLAPEKTQTVRIPRQP